jgi:HAD superfamily hydrolase (TIGR01509 family)
LARIIEEDVRIAFVFDMDGVLFDSHPVHRIAWRELLRGAGKEVSEAELDFLLDGATRDEILRHFLGALSSEKIALYSKQKDAIFQREEDRVQTIAGLEEFLDLVEAAAIPMAVASSGSKVRAERMLDKHGLRGRFAVVLTSDDVGVGKESPAIFLRAAEQLHVRPCDVVVLEDGIRAVEVVKKAGMKCIGIAAGTRGSELLKAGADLVLRDFTELKLSDLFELFQPPSAAEQKVASLPS